MKTEEIQIRLEMACTEYDRKESSKRGYNRYALGIYFNRIADIVADLKAGADQRSAIAAGFSGRLQDRCLKACGFAITTRAEEMRKGVCYEPTAAKPAVLRLGHDEPVQGFTS